MNHKEFAAGMLGGLVAIILAATCVGIVALLFQLFTGSLF